MPAATAVESATTASMEATASTNAMESAATAVEAATCITAMEATADCVTMKAANGSATITAAVATTIAAVAYATAIAVTTASVAVAADAAITVAASITPAAPPTAPVTVIPGTSADKQATRKPVRSVVAVGCAGIGIVRVVTVIADWRRRRVVIPIAAVPATDTNADCNLGISTLHERGACKQGKKQNIT